MRNGALEAQAAEEQVEAERGVRIANLQVGEKDNAQVQRMHPNCAAIGVISGTTTTIAEKMSIRLPTMSRNRFSASKNIARLVMCCRMAARICIGTCASIK